VFHIIRIKLKLIYDDIRYGMLFPKADFLYLLLYLKATLSTISPFFTITGSPESMNLVA
jgi:hypothetical protein